MKLNNLLSKYTRKRENILMILHDIQDNNPQNYIPEDALKATAEYLNISHAEVYGIVEYYTMFSLQPRGRYLIRICKSPVCRMMGGNFLLDTLSEKLEIGLNELTDDGLFSIEQCECLGHCHESPVMMVNQKVYGNLDETKIEKLISEIKTRTSSIAIAKKEKRVVLRNVGRIDPENINDYRHAGGYETLEDVLNMTPLEVMDKLAAAEFIGENLKGRGGAGFSTGQKMKFTREYGQKLPEGEDVYLICNADEGEPGTFKDRIIMEQDPHTLLEGMIITAYIIGANKGYIYVRGEYFLSIQRLKKAIFDARDNGFLGNNIFDSDFSFDIEIKLGAGSYLCGEELTLIESIEGKRGYPRIKPPFPAEKGLFGQPTLVNNVETLSNIPVIIKNGPEWYCSLGTEKSSGTKIFNLSGNIKLPGYYEVEFGITLRELIDDLGEGMIYGSSFKGALLGGAAGTFVDSSLLDIPMGYDELKEVGVTLGSGAVIIFNANVDIYELLMSILEFFKHESCGKCTPCRVGCQQLINILQKVKTDTKCSETYLKQLVEEAEYIAKNSLCPLGQSPIMPIKSAVRYFKKELAESR